ncbi:MAG: SRPBCC family protein [Elainellaceae cyanobacterium]
MALSSVTPEYNEADFSHCPSDIEMQMTATGDRHRLLTARILVPAAVERVWQTLTDYEHLADFIPNLSESRRIYHPDGGIRLEQIGSQSLLKFKFCARVVLDMIEHFPHQLNFEMVEGDFRTFKGCWQLQPADSDTNGTKANSTKANSAKANNTKASQKGTYLIYQLTVCPSRVVPVRLIEQRLGNNLCENLVAIRDRAIA